MQMEVVFKYIPQHLSSQIASSLKIPQGQAEADLATFHREAPRSSVAYSRITQQTPVEAPPTAIQVFRITTNVSSPETWRKVQENILILLPLERCIQTP